MNGINRSFIFQSENTGFMKDTEILRESIDVESFL